MTGEIDTRSDTPARPILVPVDFSAYSRAALRWALVAADCLDAPLEIVHVVHDPEAGPGFYARPKRKGFLRRMEEAAAEMMEEFIADFRRDHPEMNDLEVRTELVIGLPASRILEVAESINARLIVMGSQGRTGLGRFLIGSKAQRVAQLARIPVTIVKADSED